MNEATVLGGQEVVGVGRIEGPILIVEGATNVSYDEVVEIRDSRGQLRRGRVLEVGEGTAVIQVFAGSTGLSVDGTRIRFLGNTLHMPVAEEMLGRVFDGLGNPFCFNNIDPNRRRHPLKPTSSLKVPHHSSGHSKKDSPDKVVAIAPFQNGHMFEIHAVNPGYERQR